MKHLLVVGRPGVGKTTVIKRLVSALRNRSIDGFLTEECRERDERVGCWLSPLDGRQVLLAHRGSLEADRGGERTCRVGPYRVNLSVLEQVAVPVILRALKQSRIVILDELGKMALCSERFEQVARRAFDQGSCLVATAGVAPLPLVEAIKRRRDVELIPLTPANRDAVAEELIARLEARCAEDPRVRALERRADRICEMIIAGETPPLDIEIQQVALREEMARTVPAHHGAYALIYGHRFRRLWQQFRMPHG
jgi:nucleoside-triphosphatase